MDSFISEFVFESCDLLLEDDKNATRCQGHTVERPLVQEWHLWLIKGLAMLYHDSLHLGLPVLTNVLRVSDEEHHRSSERKCI